MLLEHGGIAISPPNTCKGMPALHQKQENQHCKTKIVVVEGTINLAKIASLEFWWRVFWFTYGATKE